MERGYFVMEWYEGVWKRISQVYQAQSAAIAFRDLAIKAGKVVELSDNLTANGKRRPMTKPARKHPEPPEGHPF